MYGQKSAWDDFPFKYFSFSLFITSWCFFPFCLFFFSCFHLSTLFLAVLFTSVSAQIPLLHSLVPLCSSQGYSKAWNSVEDCYWMAVEERRWGQAKHVTQEAGHFTSSIHKQEMWKQERESTLPPGCRLRKESGHVEAPFFPLASPQSPLLSLSLPKACRKKNNTVFAVAF